VTARAAGRLAWSLWGLAMALEVTGIALWLDNHAALLDRFGTTEDGGPHVFVVPGYTTVGAVIAARTRNRIGWLFLGFGLIAALMVFTSPYHDRGVLIAPGSLPAADVVGQLGSVLARGGQVSNAAVARFHQLIAQFPDYNGYPNNNRPVQPPNGRIIRLRRGGRRA
jgi:hypothetical protein